MDRLKLETLKKIFSSEYWIVLALGGAFFSFFALNRGGVVVFIDACLVILAINILFKEYRIPEIPVRYWITCGIFGYLLGASVLFYPKVSHYGWMVFPVRMLCLVFAIHCLSCKGIKKRVIALFFVVVSATVCWQLGAFHIFNMEYGTFSNPHYIASFSMLTLPAIVYFFWVTNGWYKLFFALIALLDFHLFLKIGSRPAIVAITTAGLFGLFLLIKDRRKWIGVVLMCAFFVILQVTNYLRLAERLEELIIHLPKEDRVQIWTAAWPLLKDNSIQAWIVGNGIGSFRLVWPKYAPSDEINEVFPHLFFLEVLYASGLTGLVIVMAGIIFLFVYSFKSLKKIKDKKIVMLSKFLLVDFIAWLIHCGLTFPIYSKYSQYSLAFILGPLLATFQNPDCEQKD